MAQLRQLEGTMRMLDLATLEQLEIYKCSLCGTVTEILSPEGIELTCCGRPMMNEHENYSTPKDTVHEFILSRSPDGLRFSVGCPLHPMDGEHRILWAEIVTEGRTARTFFAPGNFPGASFHTNSATAHVRAYCSEHGLWRSKDIRLDQVG